MTGNVRLWRDFGTVREGEWKGTGNRLVAICELSLETGISKCWVESSGVAGNMTPEACKLWGQTLIDAAAACFELAEEAKAIRLARDTARQLAPIGERVIG